MIHPLVAQLRFARSEFVRCLDGVWEEDGVKRLLPMNCVSWIVGRLSVHMELQAPRQRGKLTARASTCTVLLYT